jgi:DNA replication and repair protein RecF
MFLERLELTDFRGYARLRLDFARPLTLFEGDNAQGKTNLLEAVSLLALARSPRGARDGEMIRWGADEAIVRGEAARRARGNVAVGLTLRRDGGKALRVGGQPCARLSDGVGQLNVVFFGPGDLQLVSGSPEARREFLNTCIGQASPPYLAALGGYRQALRQRNGLLRAHRRLDENLLLAHDDALAERAATLMELRAGWAAELSEESASVHRRLSREREVLQVTYQPHCRLESESREAQIDSLREQFMARRGDELRRGLTLLGPHRDDLKVLIDGLPAKTYASQGQQRTAALALKIAELRVLARHLGEPPLLLLDDVLSELDPARRAAVLELRQEADQVLLTCTSADGLDEALAQGAARHTVVAGTVR